MPKHNAVDQLEKILAFGEKYFSPERYEKVEKLFEHFADRILVAPASGRTNYHYAYAGGYLDHILNVLNNTMVMVSAFKKAGAIIDFTVEEAVFAAMFHDLGKLGDMDEPYYIPQTSDWHREKLGEMYTHNPELPYMKVPDRALMVLQLFGIEITSKEWRAIKLADGLFDDTNKAYLIGYGPPTKQDTNLHHVIHFADHLSTIAERDEERK